jgi:hypothetical protein
MWLTQVATQFVLDFRLTQPANSLSLNLPDALTRNTYF